MTLQIVHDMHIPRQDGCVSRAVPGLPASAHVVHNMPKGLKSRSKLQSARERAGISQTEAGVKVGLSHSQVSRYERGLGSPQLDLLKAFAQVYRVPLTDVIDFGHSFLMLALVGKVAAGAWRDATELPTEDQQLVPYMPRADRPIPDGALELEGDSMNEIWPDRTIIFYKRIVTGYRPVTGHRVVIERWRAGEVEVTCKEVQVLDDGQVLLIPRSLNPAHRPVLLAGGEEDEIRIWAIVTDTLQPEPAF